ncbi:adenylate/guanylate cyclase domain-containing protein [Microvirga brassicacearum]|uniref:Adenylate/guanylate cyclase domain-containing protein n=1 Tax=Microvirga brassicacearum TaxID=2580413 RepID=A0A5N3P5N5_9HYPH|nr:adenylate/guanylate cyclase domain-containing protein [Microvirga brassicacearum]
MPDPRPKSERRLAAILAADVVGSCRLMEADEEAAASAIRAILSEIIEPAATRHRGRVVKTMGDGALLEFASPVEAVLCAVEAQSAIADLARHQPGGRTIQLRMGINLGDVLVGEDEDILGDSVNIAVRLEGMADPGGICISGKVFDELEGKLSLPFEDLGEQRLKNIARPIHVYALKAADISPREPTAARPTQNQTDKPSIAVLPFANLSGDPSQEYFADGITDDIITALTKTRWLFVTSRSSSFAFKAKAVETEQVAGRPSLGRSLHPQWQRAPERLPRPRLGPLHVQRGPSEAPRRCSEHQGGEDAAAEEHVLQGGTGPSEAGYPWRLCHRLQR